jgi:hypothetical protein
MLGALLLARGVLVPAISVASGFVLAVLVRVAVETMRDPTSHNLWPFEVVIAGGIGLVGGLVGVAAARGVKRLTGSK